MSSNIIPFLCPCEEEETQFKNATAVIAFCPFCGIKIESDDDLFIDAEEDPLTIWDESEKDDF